jgi:hypothetical protein
MFSLVAQSGGEQDREVGLPAPERNPSLSPQPRRVECARKPPPHKSAGLTCAGSRKETHDLRRELQPGKFYEVAPDEVRKD